MLNKILLLLTAVLTNIVYAESNVNIQNIVTINNGKLQGVESNGLIAFKNIPYAAAPVGELRWRPPQPAKNWDGVRDASVFGQACLQPLIKGLNDELAPGSEDCLKLNIYRPKTGSKLPVMVWFHGGGLVEGSAKEPYYQPIGLVQQGVLVVTVDYRLGKLGYFAIPELVQEAKKNNEYFGNYGTLDQIYSLKWIQDNIAQFGGDPNNVTIFGQSAGGRSVITLMTSPLAKGLFHKAIAQSAQQLPMHDLSRQKFGVLSEEQIESNYLKSLGVNQLAELRKLPAESLVISTRQFQSGDFDGAFIDGQIIVDNPLNLFLSGKQHKVPFIIGTNSWDASYFVLGQPPVAKYVEHMKENIGIIDNLYSTFKESCALSAEIMADGWYKGALKLLADSNNKYAPTYAYYFSYLPSSVRDSYIGAPHTFELPYVFGDLANVNIAPINKESSISICNKINQANLAMKESAVWSSYWYPITAPNNSEDISVMEQLNKSWTEFAKTGNPNYTNQKLWQRYSIQDDVMRNFSGKTVTHIKNLGGNRVDYQIKAIESLL